MSAPDASQPRILIADDEPGIRQILQDFFAGNYSCIGVNSAERALALLEAERFDLVLSDIVMGGGMTGLQLIPEVQRRAPNTLVVLISGAQGIENAIQAMRVGAFDYVMKPFDLRQVDAVVRRALEHHRLLEDKRWYENYLEQLVEERTAQLDRALESVQHAYRTTLHALAAALETRDAETHGHSERVVAYSLRLGRELGLSDGEMRVLEFGSLLHDIGKIGVPDVILRKPGKLTDEEWVRMREHPALGAQILRGVSFLTQAVHVVAQHHEQWDGTGYPAGLRGEEIHFHARIFAVADAFDAMTSDRVYRVGRPYEVAVAELSDFVGRQFDPQVVAAFHRIPKEEWLRLSRASYPKINLPQRPSNNVPLHVLPNAIAS